MPSIPLLITAAGTGRRLAPLTEVIPKAFLPVAVDADGRAETAVSRLIRQFREAGVGPVWIGVRKHPWFDLLGELCADTRVVCAPSQGEWLAVQACLNEGLPLGSLIVASGDNVLADDEVMTFFSAVEKHGQGCTVAVSPKASTKGLTRVEVVGNRVCQLVEKPADDKPGLGKAGIYYFDRESLRLAAEMPPLVDRFGEQSMTEILRGLLHRGSEVNCHYLRSGFHDVGSIEGIAGAVADASLSLQSRKTWNATA
jgi:dTDP-glucose pyrophosphorylase